MMTQQLEVSILAAPLAAIDRRALSQAWYSALHLARSECTSATLGRRTSRTVAAFARAVPKDVRDVTPRRRVDVGAARGVTSKPSPISAQPSAAGTPAARTSAPLSQRIERRFAYSQGQVKRATFSMGRGAARVHVILQTNGNTATLVALCRPEMRTVVARALAQARFGLAPRGLVVNLSIQGAPCF